jgi:hypothetical protein
MSITARMPMTPITPKMFIFETTFYLHYSQNVTLGHSSAHDADHAYHHSRHHDLPGQIA